MMKELGWSNALLLVEPSDLFDLNAKDLRDKMDKLGLNRPDILLLSDDNYFTDTISHIKETDIHILFGLFYEEKGRHTICEVLHLTRHCSNVALERSYACLHVAIPTWYSCSRLCMGFCGLVSFY
jgi:hypothetical protein